MNHNLNFLLKYNNKKNIRYDSFFKSLSIANARNLKTFVETGTMRGKRKFLFFSKYNWKDGMSTLIFCEYAKHVNGKLFSCDINSQNIKCAKRTTKKFINYVNFVESDSLLFLKSFKHKIDFLYLDSLDGHNPRDASMHQLNEAKSAIDKLHRNSLILLDDKNLKTTQSLEFLLANKFNILNETDEQILLGY